MKWILKALVQKAFSVFPNGERYNYFFQRRMKNLPVTDEVFVEKFGYALDRIRLLEEYGPKRPLGEFSTFEFGAGWDLIGPFSYYAMGINHQTVIDIRPNVHLELLNDTLRKFQTNLQACAELSGRALRAPDPTALNSISELESRYGIRYLAPCDAADTGLPAQSVDFIATNSTLEHIPANDLPNILLESKRLLKPDGIMCHLIDMKDHFSYFDSSITKYNFLTLSDTTWNLINSPIANQNRLRIGEYEKMFRDAGLRTVYEKIREAPKEDVQALRSLKLSPRFAGADTVERLAAHVVAVVLSPT